MKKSVFTNVSILLVAIATFGTITLSGITASAQAPAYQETEQSAPPARRARVGDINPAEKDRYRTRFESKNSTIFAFGPAFSNNVNTSKTLYSAAFGYEWEVGAQNAILAQLDGSFGDSTGYIDGIIGAKYYFSDEDVSPFIKAGFGFGTAKGAGLDAVGGFAGMIGAGVTVFRTSTTHLELGAAYSGLFASNAQGNPNVTSVTLGILF